MAENFEKLARFRVIAFGKIVQSECADPDSMIFL
jgi:hypothetical protein